ncbi:MAG TPA: hypothetical protein H9881_14900 [Candidatus Stackebrandtia excrementipullorum]|nr:hypothetical protein [Candidatus Stackebrandtia excrementipullorum]
MRHTRLELTTQLDAVAVGQSHVKNHHVDRDRRYPSQRLVDSGRLPDDLEVGGRSDHVGDASPHDLVVVDEEHPSGH